MPAMSNARRIARDTMVLTSGGLVALGINFLGTVLITRAIGPDGRGVYAWLLTVAWIAIQLATLAPLAVVRTVEPQGGEHLPATLVFLSLAGTVATLPLLAYVALDGTMGPAVRPYLAAAWLAVPITAANLSLGTLVQIDGHARRILTVQIAPRLVQLAVILALVWGRRLDLEASVWLFPFTAAIEFCLAVTALRNRIRTLRPSLSLTRTIAGLLGAGWLASVALFALPRFGLLVLGATRSLGETGQYSVALSLQEVATVAPAALGGVLITHVMRHGAPGGRGQARAAAALLGGMAGACALAALLAPVVIPLVFGRAFAPAAETFRYLLVAVLLATVYQICQPMLYVRTARMPIAIPAVSALAGAAIVALLAVPALGTNGAILSNIVGFLILAASAAALARRTTAPPEPI